MKQKLLVWCLFVIASTAVTPAFADQVLVAVAANFIPPFREIATEFEKVTGHAVRVACSAYSLIPSEPRFPERNQHCSTSLAALSLRPGW